MGSDLVGIEHMHPFAAVHGPDDAAVRGIHPNQFVAVGTPGKELCEEGSVRHGRGIEEKPVIGRGEHRPGP